MEKIKGLIDAPFTPMLANGDINLEPIPAYAAMLAENGLKGVFINGSSGEGYMLTAEERMALAEKWIAAAPAGFKVIVHVGSCCLRESAKLAAHAAGIGAWGIGAMAPPFPKIGRIEELVKYCEAIASAAPGLPFYYYHIPAFNGAFLPMLDLLKAVDGRISNFAGIKYTFESLYEYTQCRLYGNGRFDMLHGQDETILPSLAQGGAQGGIGGTTNYNGRELVGIIEAWERGDLETAREKQNFSQAVINVICNYRGNIVGGKRIIKSVAMDMVKLEKYQGVAASMTTVITLFVASITGMPVSTSHCSTAAIMGVGASKNPKRVKWDVAKSMVMAWLLTFPCCGFIGWALARIFMLF